MNQFSYPITFRIPVWQRLLTICIGILLCFMGTVMFSLPGSNGSGGWLVGSLLLLAGVLVPLFVITSKLVLYQDRIEHRARLVNVNYIVAILMVSASV